MISLKKRILNEFLIAASLRPSLFSLYFPFIQEFKVKMKDEDWSYLNPSFLYKLYQNSYFSFNEIQKIIPSNYLSPELGLSIESDYYDEIEVHFGGKLAISIAKDQIDRLSLFSSYNWFDIDQMLKIYDKIYKYSFIPLLHYSIQSNAKKCFKFLLLNGANPLLTSSGLNKWDAMAFAAATGNIEFIKILETHGVYFNENTANAAVKFHQNNILDWLTSFHLDTFTYTLFSAVETNNLEGIIYLLKHSTVNISTVQSYIIF